MKYLVTGANGFVGKHLTAALKKAGHEVVPLTRKDADLLDRDATAKFVARTNPDGIFHLAAPFTAVGQSWNEPEAVVGGNLSSTLSILGAARMLERKPRIVLASSSEVLGDHGPEPMDESTEPKPDSPYALSKLFCEQVARFYVERFELPTVIVRAFNHIGPGQRPEFVAPNFAQQIAEIERGGKSGQIKVGNLEAERDFGDVRDIVQAYITAMEQGVPGEVYHAGADHARPVKEILDGLLELSPATIEVVVDSSRFRPNDVPRQESDSSKLKELGWKPEIDFAQTLTDILEEARSNATTHG